MALELIQAGREYAMQGSNDLAPALTLSCGDVQQRNWSRVAKGRLSWPDGRTVDCFIKQYVGRDGLVHRDHWVYERDGVEYAADILGQIVRVPKLLVHHDGLMLNIFEYFAIVSIDQLLRSDPRTFGGCIETVLYRMNQVLAALQSAATDKDVTGLKLKSRDYGSRGIAVNFKGFEIRNAGLPEPASAAAAESGLVLFDFVRPYLAPVEEAAAKLFVSVGMLNWGSPVSRFINGPDTELLKRTATILQPWLDRKAVFAELDLQQKFRHAELKGERGLEVFLKWLGVSLIGRYYFARLRYWCNRNL